jgi:hypothetical protein
LAVERPCPWHAGVVNPDTGRLEVIYCEVGPAGHEGTHIGDRKLSDYLIMLRAWRREAAKRLREEYGYGGSGTGTHTEPN